MAYIGETFRIYYIAKNFVGGLSDVSMVVYKPNGVKQGLYMLTEVNMGDGEGIYYYDYADSDMEGSYLFVVNSPSNPRKDARQVTFVDKNNLGWTQPEKAQIRDALGITGDKTSSTGGVINYIKTKTDEMIVILDFLKDIEGGMWEVVDNQMVFYKSANITEVARFDLFDKSGIPAGDNVYKRMRV